MSIICDYENEAGSKNEGLTGHIYPLTYRPKHELVFKLSLKKVKKEEREVITDSYVATDEDGNQVVIPEKKEMKEFDVVHLVYEQNHLIPKDDMLYFSEDEQKKEGNSITSLLYAWVKDSDNLAKVTKIKLTNIKDN